MKISVIIPHMYGLQDVDFMLKKCIKSLVGADEIIVLANDGIGYGNAVNTALELATGDYFVIANNDCFLRQGSLRDLIRDEGVSVPTIIPQPKDYEPRAFYGFHRSLYEWFREDYGYWFDERFEKGYWEDDDLIYRLKACNVLRHHVESVVVSHLNGGGLTMHQLDRDKHYNENKYKFAEKWSIDVDSL